MGDEAAGLARDGVMAARADVLMVCDRESGVAWGKIEEMKPAV